MIYKDDQPIEVEDTLENLVKEAHKTAMSTSRVRVISSEFGSIERGPTLSWITLNQEVKDEAERQGYVVMPYYAGGWEILFWWTPGREQRPKYYVVFPSGYPWPDVECDNPDGLRIIMACCPDCAKHGYVLPGHTYCSTTDWEKQVKELGGIVLAGPRVTEWGWLALVEFPRDVEVGRKVPYSYKSR